MGDTDSLVKNCVIMTEDYYYNTDWKCVEERDSGESCPRKQYVYGIRGRNDLVARDNYLYNSSSGSPSCSSAGKERHYALTDGMGSVTAIASTAGAVVERYSYSAFGQSQVMDANFAERSMSFYDWQTRFHGENRDDETGFYNYGYRYYLPELGKWPSRDPIEEEGGVNLYAFVGNDGINHRDALGLYTLENAQRELSERGVEPDLPSRVVPPGYRIPGAYSNTQLFDEWLRLERADTAWLGTISECPDKICVINGEPKNCDVGGWSGLSEASQRFHPGADYCMRSEGGASGQQCCYKKTDDPNWLELIKSGVAAGTPDRIAAGGLGHFNHDVATYTMSERLGRTGDYLSVRPPSQGGGECYE
jgi:RHS repeat-associated protein